MSRAVASRTLALLAVALAAAAGGAACSKKAESQKTPPPELAGLDAVPASARVVIGASPKRLAGSALVDRAVSSMVSRDPELAARIDRLASACALDVRALDTVHVALTDAAAQPLLVATGPLREAELAPCLQATVGAGGGALTVEAVDGRTLYQVREGERSVWFAFGRKDTVIVSASRDLVLAGLGNGPKVYGDADMRALLQRADTKAPLWAVGRVPDDWSSRLGRLTGDRVKTPPRAFLGALDPGAGLVARLGAVMATEEDAKALESQLNPTLALVSMAAQARGLGPLAAKISGTRDGEVVTFGVELTPAEVNELLSKVDSRPPPEQDASPAAAAPAGDAVD